MNVDYLIRKYNMYEISLFNKNVYYVPFMIALKDLYKVNHYFLYYNYAHSYPGFITKEPSNDFGRLFGVVISDNILINDEEFEDGYIQLNNDDVIY